MRECLDDNPKTLEVKFNGGIMGDDVILLCTDCILRHPFNKQIISKEELKKNEGFVSTNPRTTPRKIDDSKNE